MESNTETKTLEQYNVSKRKREDLSDSETSDISCEIILYLGKLNETLDDESSENDSTQNKHKKVIHVDVLKKEIKIVDHISSDIG